jgi:predicted ester cyclase
MWPRGPSFPFPVVSFVEQGVAAMSSSQLKESTGSTTDLAHRYLDAAWNRMDLSALDELARTDLYVYYPLMPEATTDRESFKQTLQAIRAGMPDLHFDLRHVATHGDTAVFSWQASGEHSGDLLGLAPTGRSVQWTGLSVVEMSDGRVAKEWGEEDALGFFRQLGVVPD